VHVPIIGVVHCQVYFLNDNHYNSTQITHPSGQMARCKLLQGVQDTLRKLPVAMAFKLPVHHSAIAHHGPTKTRMIPELSHWLL
jgi:hypothetical protein